MFKLKFANSIAIMKAAVTSLLLAAAAAPVLARDVPQNIKDLYNSIRGQGQCNNMLKGGFYSQEGDSKGASGA